MRADEGEEPDDNPYRAPRSSDRPTEIDHFDLTKAVTSASFHLTDEDVKQFQAAFTPRTSRLLLPVMIVLFLLVIVSCIATLALIVRHPPRSGLLRPLLTSAMPLVIIVAVFAWHFLAARRRGAGPSAEIVAVLTPEGLLTRHEGVSETRHAWAGIAEIRDDEHLILFVMKDLVPAGGRRNPTTAFLVPRRAFPTPEAAGSFLRAARHWHATATTR